MNRNFGGGNRFAVLSQPAGGAGVAANDPKKALTDFSVPGTWPLSQVGTGPPNFPDPSNQNLLPQGEFSPEEVRWELSRVPQNQWGVQWKNLVDMQAQKIRQVHPQLTLGPQFSAMGGGGGFGGAAVAYPFAAGAGRGGGGLPSNPFGGDGGSASGVPPGAGLISMGSQPVNPFGGGVGLQSQATAFGQQQQQPQQAFGAGRGGAIAFGGGGAGPAAASAGPFGAGGGNAALPANPFSGGGLAGPSPGGVSPNPWGNSQAQAVPLQPQQFQNTPSFATGPSQHVQQPQQPGGMGAGAGGVQQPQPQQQQQPASVQRFSTAPPPRAVETTVGGTGEHALVLPVEPQTVDAQVAKGVPQALAKIGYTAFMLTAHQAPGFDYGQVPELPPVLPNVWPR
uniref:Uncharacterized protein n=1 Tax=Chromera velia CCMP2878 TaxID=1169474 RepID=A0A0G4I9C2_9ALVE|eukprot:Cvel_12221.t1-p1 / transcript=Cvel_12221.t1 / gene=Cvel_12221 / organism=Chromera_velia_CCMP2878 / gene_product=hypothetical protein / transcript_product=hypothetical protein / location=Cvel_scaffold791:2298-6751(+) / protein_length=394 / sequence_SO=supercontig / SO=protein_coding / is_pseudo=false